MRGPATDHIGEAWRQMFALVWEQGYNAGATDAHNWDAFAVENEITPNPYGIPEEEK